MIHPSIIPMSSTSYLTFILFSIKLTTMSIPRLAAACFQNENTHFIQFLIFLHLLLPFCHPLSFNITRFDPTATSRLYAGDATPSVGAIELTRIKYTCRVGRVSFGEPIHLWDSSTRTLADFTTRFSFTIDTLNASIYGNGLAFFLAPVGYPIPPNSDGGFLGLLNTTTSDAVSQNHIVSVEFDTFVDEWDPPVQHVGINKNSISSSVYVSWDAGSQSGKMANVWIVYSSTTKNLSVFWTYEENAVYMGDSSLSYQIDLMRVLPEWVTIGFSAATGSAIEQNTIYSWEFSSKLEKRGKSSKHWKTILIAVFVVCFFFLKLGVVVGWLVLKKYRKATETNHGNGINGGTFMNRDIELGALPKRFSYQELVQATNNFANETRLGQGGFGQVYQGILGDLGHLVAVKRVVFAESEHAERFFINEAKIISRLVHQNQVQFIGWCRERAEFFLVYDFMPNHSLDTHLFGYGRTLSWNLRYQIARGLASALLYLHEESAQGVLHRDVKSANVFLDSHFCTKLGDFGFAKLMDSPLRTQTTGVLGTFGYSKETDMYSFGIVALEIACGRRAFEDGNNCRVLLVSWAWELYLAGKILEAADERLNLIFDANEMERLMIVGLWCTHPNDRERPKARQVIQVLESELPLPELPHDMHDNVFHPTALSQRQVDSVPPSIASSFDYEDR